MAKKNKRLVSDTDPVSPVINEAMDAAKEIYNGFAIYREHRKKNWEKVANKAMAFYFGEQWSQEDKTSLEEQRRPPAVFNMCLPAVDLIVGYQVQNDIDFVTEPVDKYSDPMIAEILTSGMKYIENCNTASFERRFQFLRD